MKVLNRILVAILVALMLVACSGESPEQAEAAQERARQAEEDRHSLRATEQSQLAFVFAMTRRDYNGAVAVRNESGNRLRYNSHRDEIRSHMQSSAIRVLEPEFAFQGWEGHVQNINVGMLYVTVTIAIDDPAGDHPAFQIYNPHALTTLALSSFQGAAEIDSGFIEVRQPSPMRSVIEGLDVGQKVRVSGRVIGTAGGLESTNLVVAYTEIDSLR